MSEARRLSLGKGPTGKARKADRGVSDGPWPRLRAVLREEAAGKPVDLDELDELIARAGRTPAGRVYRTESVTYARATALRDRLRSSR